MMTTTCLHHELLVVKKKKKEKTKKGGKVFFSCTFGERKKPNPQMSWKGCNSSAPRVTNCTTARATQITKGAAVYSSAETPLNINTKTPLHKKLNNLQPATVSAQHVQSPLMNTVRCCDGATAAAATVFSVLVQGIAVSQSRSSQHFQQHCPMFTSTSFTDDSSYIQQTTTDQLTVSWLWRVNSPRKKL